MQLLHSSFILWCLPLCITERSLIKSGPSSVATLWRKTLKCDLRFYEVGFQNLVSLDFRVDVGALLEISSLEIQLSARLLNQTNNSAQHQVYVPLLRWAGGPTTQVQVAAAGRRLLMSSGPHRFQKRRDIIATVLQIIVGVCMYIFLHFLCRFYEIDRASPTLMSCRFYIQL